MKHLHSISNLKYRVFCAVLFIGGMNLVNAQTNQYPINDPRNPDCPCHKYQKLAEEEYKKLLSRSNTNPVQLKKNLVAQIDKKIPENNTPGVAEFEKMKILNEVKLPVQNEGTANHEINSSAKGISNPENVVSNKGSSGGTSVGKKKKHAYTKHRRKKRNCRYKKWSRIFDVKHWDIWKEFRDVSSCYHWK